MSHGKTNFYNIKFHTFSLNNEKILTFTPKYCVHNSNDRDVNFVSKCQGKHTLLEYTSKLFF